MIRNSTLFFTSLTHFSHWDSYTFCSSHTALHFLSACSLSHSNRYHFGYDRRSESISSLYIEFCRFCNRIAKICIAFALFMCCTSLSSFSLHLISLILIRYHDSRRNVCDSNGWFRFIDMLSAFSARPKQINTKIWRSNQRFHVFHFG